MAGSVNKVILVGNLGQDPDIRTTQDGRKIANFSVATSESWRDKNTGERREKTEWHRVVIFNDGLITNVIEPYVKKGQKIYVEGTLKTRKWQDQSGQDKYTTEVVIQAFNGSIELLSSKPNGPGYSDDPGAYGRESGAPDGGGTGNQSRDPIDDDIPF